MKRTMTLQQACDAYVHRYTAEHIPNWAAKPCEGSGKYYAPQFASDKEWYEHTAFPGESECIGDDGTHCFTTGETWPLGQWLNAPYTTRAYWIVDDVINERGTEGFELMFGNPFSSIGYHVEYGKTIEDLLRVRPLSNELVYRVKLARRHGDKAGVRLIKR